MASTLFVYQLEFLNFWQYFSVNVHSLQSQKVCLLNEVKGLCLNFKTPFHVNSFGLRNDFEKYFLIYLLNLSCRFDFFDEGVNKTVAKIFLLNQTILSFFDGLRSDVN